MTDPNELLDREYFQDYFECVVDYVDTEHLSDELYDELRTEIEDFVFELFLHDVRCGIATHFVETMFKLFKTKLKNGK